MKQRTKSVSLHRKKNSEILLGSHVGCDMKNGFYDMSKENDIPDFRPYVSSFYKTKPKFDYPPINYEEEQQDPWKKITGDILTKWAPKAIHVPNYEKMLQTRSSFHQKTQSLKTDLSDTENGNDNSREDTPKTLKHKGSMSHANLSSIKLPENFTQNPKDKLISSLRRNLVRNLILDGSLNSKSKELVDKLRNNRIDDTVLDRIKKPILEKNLGHSPLTARNYASADVNNDEKSKLDVDLSEFKSIRRYESSVNISHIVEFKIKTPTVLCKVELPKEQLFIPIQENTYDSVASITSLGNAMPLRSVDRVKSIKSNRLLSPTTARNNRHEETMRFHNQPKLTMKIKYLARRKSDVSKFSGGECKKLSSIQHIRLDNEHKLVEIDNPEFSEPKITEKTETNERIALRNKTLLLKKQTNLSRDSPKSEQVLSQAKARRKTQIYDLKMPRDAPAILATFKATRIKMMTPIGGSGGKQFTPVKSNLIKNDITEFFPGRRASTPDQNIEVEEEKPPVDFFDLNLSKKKLEKINGDLNKRLKDGDLAEAFTSMVTINPRAAHIFNIDKTEQKRLGAKVSYLKEIQPPRTASTRAPLNSSKLGKSTSVSKFEDPILKISPYELPGILVKNSKDDKGFQGNMKFAIFLKNDIDKDDSRSARTLSKASKIRSASTARVGR